MSTMTVAEQVAMIKEATRKATKSKAAAEKFLISAGIKSGKSTLHSVRPAKRLTKHS